MKEKEIDTLEEANKLIDKVTDEQDKIFLDTASIQIDSIATSDEQMEEIIEETKSRGYQDIARYFDFISRGHFKIKQAIKR